MRMFENSERSIWKTIGYVLATLIGAFAVFLAFGMGVSVDGGVQVGSVVVFAALLLGGIALAGWAIRRLRG